MSASGKQSKAKRKRSIASPGAGRREFDIRVGGMTCVNCQNRIERKLAGTEGVLWARVSYADGRARAAYDPVVTSGDALATVIERLGYRPVRRGEKSGTDARRIAGILIVVAAAFLLLRNIGFTTSFGNIPLAEEGMGYGLLFVVGLLTSAHCVAMCGGINISQCMPATMDAQSDSEGDAPKPRFTRAASVPSLKYNLARVASYTLVGALVGGVGSVFSLTGDAKGVIQLIAGVFMVLMGLSMFGVLPGIGRLTPRLPRALGKFVESAGTGGKGPVVVGLLNGLMPCGPLQSMQLFALSTGSPVQGALSMFFFGLGTTPLMFGLGALSALIGGKFTRRAMTAGAALVIFLGLFMFSNGLTLSGASFGVVKSSAPPDVASGGARNSGGDGQDAEGNAYATEDGVQIVRSTLRSGGYPHITVRAGEPVRWIIDAPDGSVNGCNGAIYIPEYGIEYAFEPGENVIEFTPEDAGEFPYSCWMGMITSSITVEA